MSHPNSNASFINIWDHLIWRRSPNLTRSLKLAAAPNWWFRIALDNHNGLNRKLVGLKKVLIATGILAPSIVYCATCTAQWLRVTRIVECPMIDHVRWPITHFVGHPLNHVDDVMQCFCSILIIEALSHVLPLVEYFCWKVMMYRQEICQRVIFVCIYVHSVHCVSMVKYFVKIQRNENCSSDLLTCEHSDIP